MKNWQTYAGWIGAVLIIIGFANLSFGVFIATDLSYQLLNLFGAIGIVIAASSKKDFPSAFLNSVFALIACIALAKILF